MVKQMRFDQRQLAALTLRRMYTVTLVAMICAVVGDVSFSDEIAQNVDFYSASSSKLLMHCLLSTESVFIQNDQNYQCCGMDA